MQRFEEIMRFYQSRWVDTAMSTAKPVIEDSVLVKVGRALPLISPAYDNAFLMSNQFESLDPHFAALN